MTGIRRVSQLGTTGESTYVDGSIQAVDIAANVITQDKLSTDIPLSGFRNVLINGDMRINQRGSSYTLSGNYTLDRWYLGVNTSHTVSQSTSSPPAGFQNFMRVQRTSGSTNTTVPQIAQSLETSASIPLQGKQVTVSFYARAGANYSATSNTFNWRIYGGTGTDQNSFSYTGSAIPVDQSVTLTTSWQRFSYTVSSLTSYNEYAFFFYYATTGTAGAADYFDITGVQIEVGSQATPFEQRPIGVELALCQRYYYRYTGITSGGYTRIPSLIGSTGSSGAQGVMYNPVPLRTLNGASSIESFQVSVSDNLTFDSGYGTLGLNAQNSSANTTFITISSIAGTFTQGLARVLILTTTAGYIGVSAEL